MLRRNLKPSWRSGSIKLSMDFLSGKTVKNLCLAVFFIAVGSWYFLQNDEKYLQRKTKHFILLAAISSPVSETQAAYRVREMSSFLRFDVAIQVEIQGKTYMTKNLQKTKAALFPYFIQAQTAHWKEENLNIDLNREEKTAFVSFDTARALQ